MKSYAETPMKPISEIKSEEDCENYSSKSLCTKTKTVEIISNKKIKPKMTDFFAKKKKKLYFSGFTKEEQVKLNTMAKEINLDVTQKVEECDFLITKYANTSATQALRKHKLNCYLLNVDFVLESYKLRRQLLPGEFIFSEKEKIVRDIVL